MRVLVTGAGGLLGAAVLREFADVQVQAVTHRDLDIADAAAVASAIASARPDVVINCAAYNDVDRAEQDPSTALRVNALGVLALAHAARDAGATLVHYSTDFVFDGEGERPYIEEDAPNPRSVYGASKLLGDWFAADASSRYVMRVASLFGNPGPAGARRGSLGVIIDRIRSGADVPVFVDRTVSPSYTSDVARATRAVIERSVPSGVYHCSNAGAGSWAEVGAEAARLLDRPFRMKPLTLASAGLVAVRPRYCALSPAKLADLGIAMPTWQDALRRYISDGA